LRCNIITKLPIDKKKILIVVRLPGLVLCKVILTQLVPEPNA